MNNKSSCYDCEHYTDKLGKNGYCKYYRHDISVPEMICSKFEEKIKINKKIDNQGEKNKETKKADNLKDESKTRQNNYKIRTERILLASGILGCIILMIIGLIFGASIGSAVFPIQAIPFWQKLVFAAVILLIVLGISLLILTLVRKFVQARIIVFISTLVLVMIILMNYNSIWFELHSFTMDAIEAIFNVKI